MDPSGADWARMVTFDLRPGRNWEQRLSAREVGHVTIRRGLPGVCDGGGQGAPLRRNLVPGRTLPARVAAGCRRDPLLIPERVRLNWRPPVTAALRAAASRLNA